MTTGDDEINAPIKTTFRFESKELSEWVEMKHNKGEFKDRTHVINTALKRMRENDQRDGLV
jgi:Arc/MetJ-type ribon-helix-helix transcriptional regulator